MGAEVSGSLEPSSIFSAKSLHDSGDSVARLGDDRQTGPDFLGAFPEPEHDPSSFAVGGKGLASAAGAADARKNIGCWDQTEVGRPGGADQGGEVPCRGISRLSARAPEIKPPRPRC